ncbi:magnesium transporter MgtC [Dehalococcoides mccartyi]|jgi:putative Mg2+ transporter-C (MgtC) family protein|uniref:MgtC/SapB family protein n=2 Tax=Dehalococcoides mccartyi TaxID=61435 RepID=UPI0004E05A58|nr:MgtC/SapB family protein [Dehalococcoides mccartyi]AII57909.1 magnesium transporter MgtC [Dehalococcoides mccartyi CG1]APH12427.1 magnesium transporter MgtC [Dehalococcoides mccartyi]
MPIEVEMLFRILLAVVLGGAIGYERERSGKAAGLRTNTLICVGSCLITLVSIYGFSETDISRIAAGIVTGVGFLGAGAILRQSEGHVEGLTTAATIWAVAGIGLAVGAGMYFLSAVSTGVILLILLIDRVKFR